MKDSSRLFLIELRIVVKENAWITVKDTCIKIYIEMKAFVLSIYLGKKWLDWRILKPDPEMLLVLIWPLTFECVTIRIKQEYVFSSVSTMLLCCEITFIQMMYLKGGLLLKIKNLNIHLYQYFIVTKYLWNDALVEYIDNWTQSYSLVIIYRNHKKLELSLNVINTPAILL